MLYEVITYLPLTNGKTVYNCSIIDLYDRRVVASVNDMNITSKLAIKALQQAFTVNPKRKDGLILHSDQGSQFTSKEFTDFCKSVNITQSMSRAGCPYDNAPMERFYNTMKTELFYQYYFKSYEELNKNLMDYIFIWYNYHVITSYSIHYTKLYEFFHPINLKEPLKQIQGA